MRYYSDVSAAPLSRARDGFVNNWGLSPSADVKWRISHLSNWQDMLEDELDLGRPILYAGYTSPYPPSFPPGLPGGHAWVIDGYRNINGTFSCKWGWYQTHDGWYNLGNFDPPGNSGPYNEFEKAIFNVYPEQQRITGPDIVCSSNSTFSLNNLPDGAAVTWTASGTVTPGSGNGANATFHSTCSDIGYGQVTFTVLHPCDTMQFTRTYTSGGPSPADVSLTILDNLTGQPVDPRFLCPNTMYNLYYENSSSCYTSNYSWTLPYGMTLVSTSQNFALIYTNSSYGGMLMVHGQTCCTGCGSNMLLLTDYLFTDGYNCGGGWYMGFTPNPTSNETELELKTEKIKNYQEGDEWEMMIYDMQMTLIQQPLILKDKKCIIKTYGWREGMYIVRVKIKDKMLYGKFIVER